MFFQLLKKRNFVSLIIFPLVVISYCDLTLDFTVTPATPTAAESVAQPVTAAATRSSATQTKRIEGTQC